MIICAILECIMENVHVIFLKAGPEVKEMLKYFLRFFRSCGYFVWRSRSVCAILVEGIMENIHAKLFSI